MGSRGIAWFIFLILVLDEGGWLMPCFGCFIPRSDLIPCLQEVGCSPGLVWMDAENLGHTTI